jgi:hypothetical protein
MATDSFPLGTRKSKAHIAFTEAGEFYVRDGEVFRAQAGNAFDVYGYRFGRWESSVAHFRHFCRIFGVTQEAIDWAAGADSFHAETRAARAQGGAR